MKRHVIEKVAANHSGALALFGAMCWVGLGCCRESAPSTQTGPAQSPTRIDDLKVSPSSSAGIRADDQCLPAMICDQWVGWALIRKNERSEWFVLSADHVKPG